MIRDPSDGSVRKPAGGLAALKAKYGDNWGIEPPSKPERQTYRVLTADELSAYYRNNPERVVRLMGEGGNIGE